MSVAGDMDCRVVTIASVDISVDPVTDDIIDAGSVFRVLSPVTDAAVDNHARLDVSVSGSVAAGHGQLVVTAASADVGPNGVEASVGINPAVANIDDIP